MIISLHLPKTAGTSFASTLEQHFEKEFLKDSADLPMNTPQYERNKAALQASLCNAESDFSGIECIHGHFLPIKYLLLANKRKMTFVTWMRNPVERVLSHYFYWKRSSDILIPIQSALQSTQNKCHKCQCDIVIRLKKVTTPSKNVPDFEMIPDS